MQIISFLSHYQLVYISFDISSFSLISYTSLTHRSHICTHLALILHSSVTHRKKKKNEEEKYSPHTPYKKKKIKEEEKPNILPYVRILGRERYFSANFSKSERAFWLNLGAVGQVGRVGRVRLVGFLRLL